MGCVVSTPFLGRWFLSGGISLAWGSRGVGSRFGLALERPVVQGVWREAMAARIVPRNGGVVKGSDGGGWPGSTNVGP